MKVGLEECEFLSYALISNSNEYSFLNNFPLFRC